ncbi:hypothetical protein ACP4OV_016892 [Aristida adscensionis]
MADGELTRGSGPAAELARGDGAGGDGSRAWRWPTAAEAEAAKG